MLWHYIMVTARGLVRHKLYSFINIAGLALGLACATLIALFIRYETSYDRWVPDSAHLYRMELTASLPGRQGLYKTALTPGDCRRSGASHRLGDGIHAHVTSGREEHGAHGALASL